MHDRRGAILFTLLLSLGAIYALACFVAYRNQWYVREIKQNKMVSIAMKEEANRRALHDNVFFRELAEKAQFYPHNPKTVETLYRLALVKGPSDCNSFTSLAMYLASRDCCKSEITKLWQQAVNRCPNDSRTNYLAGLYFFSDHQNNLAFSYLKHSQELVPGLLDKLYLKLESLGADQDTLISITPDDPRSQMQLVRYLLRRGGTAPPQMKPKLERLQNLDPREELAVAQIALKNGWYEIAGAHAAKAQVHGAAPGAALRILAEVSWRQGSYGTADNFSRAAQRAFIAAGDRRMAAETALSMAKLFAAQETPEQTKTRLLQIVEEYPDFRPARRELNLLEKQPRQQVR